MGQTVVMIINDLVVLARSYDKRIIQKRRKKETEKEDARKEKEREKEKYRQKLGIENL